MILYIQSQLWIASNLRNPGVVQKTLASSASGYKALKGSSTVRLDGALGAKACF